MKIEPTASPGVLIIESERSGDAGGFFQGTWHQRRYAEAGIDASFMPENVPNVPTSGSLVTRLRTIKASGRIHSINIQVSSVVALSTMIHRDLVGRGVESANGGCGLN